MIAVPGSYLEEQQSLPRSAAHILSKHEKGSPFIVLLPAKGSSSSVSMKPNCETN